MSKRRELTRQINSPSEIPFAIRWLQSMTEKGLASGAVLWSISRPRRTKDQNSKQWPMLTDISRQREMVINGVPTYADPEDWKDVLTAAFRQEMRVAQGINGGVVMLGMRTSKMRKTQFCEWIEFLYAYGAEHGIEWSERSQETISEYRRAA